MKPKLFALIIIYLLCGSLVMAQSSTRQMLKLNTTPTVIPVWNVHSGQIEALLVLENNPETQSRSWVKPSKGSSIIWPNQKANNVNLDNGMALFCMGQTNSFNQISGLENCQMGKKSNQYPAINSPSLETKALLQRKVISSESSILSNLSNQERQLLRTEFDAPVPVANKSLNLASTKTATEGWVSINGNITRAKIIPASQFPNGVPTEWDKKTFEIPERQKSLSGEVIGNVIQIPGQDSNIQSVGANLTWKTPWKGKVSVGAEGMLSQGRATNSTSSQAPIIDQRIDGVVPYVRVEIDL
jgi:hypothetical protein